jgi:replicative DNA helicase
MRLDSCGGDKYIAGLTTQVYDINNFKEFLDFIKKAYKTRTFVGMTTGINLENTKIDSIDNKISTFKDDLDKLLIDSISGGTFKITDLIKESYNTIVTRVQNPGIAGISCGLHKIDEITSGFCGGDLWYIAGRPGAGKTAQACKMVLEMGKSGIPTLYFSKEMSRQPIMDRFLSLDSQVPLFNIRNGYLNQEQLEQVRESAKRLKELPIYIDLDFSSQIEQVEATIRKYKSTNDIKIIFIDYIQILSERDEQQTQELGRISRKLKLLANELSITVIVLSQLNRGVETREDKRPMMSDLRQCGNMEEDADLVIGLYRDEYYHKDNKQNKGKLEFIILKARNGPTGTIMLNFNKNTVDVYE